MCLGWLVRFLLGSRAFSWILFSRIIPGKRYPENHFSEWFCSGYCFPNWIFSPKIYFRMFNFSNIFFGNNKVYTFFTYSSLLYSTNNIMAYRTLFRSTYIHHMWPGWQKSGLASMLLGRVSVVPVTYSAVTSWIRFCKGTHCFLGPVFIRLPSDSSAICLYPEVVLVLHYHFPLPHFHALRLPALDCRIKRMPHELVSPCTGLVGHVKPTEPQDWAVNLYALFSTYFPTVPV